MQFDRWFTEALDAGQPEPEAMALATAGDGGVSVRFVLMRGHDARGFVFYTDTRSHKGGDIASNPYAAVAFCWSELGRQVRARGPIAQVAPAESDAYFAARPRGAQISAWTSEQSAVVEDRHALEERFATEAERFEPGAVPRPPWWGGYRLSPAEVEFWQNRADRLHDRLRYRLVGGGWVIERLSP